MTKRLGEYKHVWLLVTLVAGQIVQPLMAHESVTARIVASMLFFAVTGVVLGKLLTGSWERLTGVLMILPAIVIDLAHYGFRENSQPLAMSVAFHISLTLFLLFSVCMILVHVFGKRELAIDDVFGAFSGYLIVAILFGNLYSLMWLLVPDAYNIDSHILWQLSEWHTRRSLFTYFSFATLASVGYGDITTTTPASNTLVWLEVMFGQFYMAVVVSTIVGTRLARVLAPESQSKT